MQQNELRNIYMTHHTDIQNAKKELKSFDDRATKTHY